jgi:hypothetical protein
VISIDFIVKLPESHGYDAIMCVIDSLIKRAHFILTHTTINAEGTALLFLKEVWKHHGTPWAVISDRGPQFVAADNLNTTQTLECTKEKYNAKIKMKGSLLRSHQQPM